MSNNCDEGSSLEEKGKARLAVFEYKRLQPLWIAVYVDILGFTILIPFLPFFMEQFHVSAVVIGLLLSTNAIFGTFFGPILGKLSDKYGRKPLLLISQAGTLAGFLMLAFSQDIYMLFISRIVDGVFGGNFPIAKAVIGDVVPPKDRSKQMTNIGVAHVLASLVGPGLGGALSRWGIMAPGLVAAVLSAGTIILTFLWLEESAPAKVDPEFHQRNQKSRKEARTEIWHDKTARFLLLQWAFHTLSFTIYVTTITLFANLALGLNAEQVGYILMLSGVVRVIVRFVFFEPLLDKLGERRTSFLGLAIFVGLFFALAFVHNWVQFLLVLSGVSFAASCTRGVLNGFMSRAVGPDVQGKVQGYATSFDNIAQIVGPLLGGFVLGYLDPTYFGIIVGVISIVPFLMTFKPIRLEGKLVSLRHDEHPCDIPVD